MSEISTSGPDLDRRPLHERARTLWVLAAGAVLVVVGIVGGIGLAVAEGPWWFVLLLTPLVVAAGAAYAGLHWRHWWWGTGPDALEVGHGVVIRHASYVPYHRIQQIDVERGPLERALGLARLTVHTASATTDAGIPGLAIEDARALRVHLLQRAGRDDGV